jgi:hypothetical protein
MTGKPSVMVDLDAAQPKLLTNRKAMNVIAHADAGRPLA